MPTLTLEIPQEVADLLADLPEDERAAFAIAALREKIEAEQEGENTLNPANYTLTPEDLEDIGHGLADADAGRVVDGETFFAELRQHIEQLKQAKRQVQG